MLEKVQQIAVDHFLAFLKVCADSNATFRQILTVDMDGVALHLLLVGEAHGNVEDGYCIAILNPDENLMSEVKTGLSYLTPDLLAKVENRCDAMLKI